jgi:LmbE family N-acetylglucosaminyl deacetylase
MTAPAPGSIEAAVSEAGIRRTLGRPVARVLFVGPRAEARGVAWLGSGAETRTLASAAGLESAAGPWDVVVLDGALEAERWDRWLVQRVHRIMAPGGVLVVSADNMLNVWSATGLSYLASRVVRQLRRRVSPRGAIPAADRAAFRGRRYAVQPLLAMVRGVGFEVQSWAMEGHGLPPPLAALLGPLGPRTARAITLVARRLPSVWGEGRPFPERGAMLAAFRASHAAPIEARDAWHRRLGSTAGCRDLDVSAWATRGAVVFSPHPDDEVIGCGGTLLDLVAHGGEVTIVQVTDGSDSAAFIDEPDCVRRQVRLDEAKRVADRIGARELLCLRADNRALHATPELRRSFREVLDRTRAGVAFAPSFTDIHPDHQTVLRLLAAAMREMSQPKPDVALYEVWSLVAPSHVHEVSASIGRIEDLLLAYETALKIDDYVHLVAERLLFNSYEHRGRAGYLEGFEVLPAARFLELASAHFGGDLAGS